MKFNFPAKSEGNFLELCFFILKICISVRYLHRFLFSRMIHTSLESVFTQLNFFLHNLAQMRFFGHEEGALLSFIPKTYRLVANKTMQTAYSGVQKSGIASSCCTFFAVNLIQERVLTE